MPLLCTQHARIIRKNGFRVATLPDTGILLVTNRLTENGHIARLISGSKIRYEKLKSRKFQMNIHYAYLCWSMQKLSEFSWWTEPSSDHKRYPLGESASTESKLSAPEMKSLWMISYRFVVQFG